MNNTTDCLFIGGPREGLTTPVPDQVNDLVAISKEEAEIAAANEATDEELKKVFGYHRVGETNIFAHASLNEEQIEAIIANETEPEDEDFDEEFEAKLHLIRDLVTASLALSHPDSDVTPLLFEAIGELNDIL
jgi:hypothetical protein